MPTDRLALYTVVYPGVEPYLPQWYASVRSQTDQHFDLWVSLDGLGFHEVEAAVGRDIPAQWAIAEPGASPAGLRSTTLELLSRRYPAVVLVDSDDVLEPSRVEAARAGLRSADVVGCALRVANAEARPLGPVLAPPADPDWERLLARHNVFGLSNTAYRAEVLRACLPLPPQAVLSDWLLVLRAWGAGAALCFDRVPRMLYRQHGSNVARVVPPFTPEYVLRAAELVLGHYQHVLGPAAGIPPDRLESVRQAGGEAAVFERTMRTAPARLGRYVEALNRLEPRYVWWWCVANPLLEELWKS